ncbi:kinase-like domain-containing protein [Daldinia decipiens]|uniref:kinase-like domain-containing protein n=1 Tax=Daldinia decipiens TaxID=326647 RepID=UPI0020C23AE5|nr:kinase-like domain-containing protein [Daldinia decipiens]KAI1655473.1 kinase-like domain-containing protein [Daldinia decipiens]
MSSQKRITLFVEDALSKEDDSVPLQTVAAQCQSPSHPSDHITRLAESKPPRTRSRYPVKRLPEEVRLVPVISGSPWNHYERKYRLDGGSSFGIIIPRDGKGRQSMIRTISGSNLDEQIQNIRQLSHENIVKNIEIYISSDQDYYLISEFMPVSLMHLCQAPIYPTEPQLSSILHQVLMGVEFLLTHGLVHEQLSCANVLMDFDGDVKICDIEHCSSSGKVAKLRDSFSRMVMRLMDKKKDKEATVGLTQPQNWSRDAFELFTMTTTSPNIKELLQHKFMEKKDKQKLIWLVPAILMTAYHRIEFDTSTQGTPL